MNKKYFYTLTKPGHKMSDMMQYQLSTVPISNYVIFGAYSVVQAFVFPKDFSDEMIVEEIRKYFSIKPFEEEPSNPLHISKFNGYENPITLSR